MRAHTFALTAAALITLFAASASAMVARQVVNSGFGGLAYEAPGASCSDAPARPGAEGFADPLPEGVQRAVSATPEAEAEAEAESESEWVVLEACVLVDGTGSRVMLGDEEWDTDDCQQVYELGLVSTGRRAGLIPIGRLAIADGTHRLAEVDVDLATFWAPCPYVDGAVTVYGYEAGTGGWGYSPMAFADWESYGFVDEQALFSAWPQ